MGLFCTDTPKNMLLDGLYIMFSTSFIFFLFKFFSKISLIATISFRNYLSFFALQNGV